MNALAKRRMTSFRQPSAGAPSASGTTLTPSPSTGHR
jgi:hypothetical protein